MGPFSHVWRVFTLILLAGLLGCIAQRVLRPKGFGELGHFRAGSLGEIMTLEVIHVGRESCRECHEKQFLLHAKDIHFDVECEDCHGPGNIHVRYHRGDEPALTAQQAAMPREYNLEGCLFCHRKLAARPKTFAQIDRVEHYRSLQIADYKIRCVDCHSPHEPLFLLDAVHSARIHPVIFECLDCHPDAPRDDHRAVPDHPTIFVCDDCHPLIAKDFPDHEHAFMKCTGCHLFYRENDTSGRIFNNANRSFCLLCHEAKPFKKQDTLPQIVYADHLEEMSKVTRRDRADLEQDPAVCLTCHLDIAHDNRLLERLRERK